MRSLSDRYQYLVSSIRRKTHSIIYREKEKAEAFGGDRVKRKGKSPCNIMGHDLTWAEFEVLNVLTDYLRMNAGDSGWSPSTSPRGDGREVSINEIFGARNNRDNARRQTVYRLHAQGILRVCDIEFHYGMLKGVPYRGRPEVTA